MKHRPLSRSASQQRGVVLLFSLVALVVLLIAAVALMRSFNTSMFMSGNIAFKRDLQNQGERAIEKALTSFRTGNPLDNDTARSADLPTSNYSAVMLPTNVQGIPNDLVLSDLAFAAKWTHPDITPGNEPSLANQGVTIRYIIDRMSNLAGSCGSLGPTTCIMAGNKAPAGGSSSQIQNATRALPSTPGASAPKAVITGTAVYRLTVRVIGPRDTQAFFQSTFTAP
jgi:type IV pilus assembly protein PilX